jgi:uncharacterized protein HemX
MNYLLKKIKAMKKHLLYIILLVAIAAGVVSGCRTQEQKVDKAREELEKAKLEYLAEVEIFRSETKAKTVTNEQMITELKARIAKEKLEVRVVYEKRITELEKRNSELRKSVDEYNDEGKEKWESFKTEFSNDMDELGIALKDFFRDNKK